MSLISSSDNQALIESVIEILNQGEILLVENDRFAALNATRELRSNYRRFPTALLSRELNVTCKTSYATTGSQVATSTVGREMMYVVAHAVHHYALICIMGGM